MSTRLYEEFILGDTSDRGDLQRKVWAATPWIVDAYTGRESLGERERDYAIRQWLSDTLGPESWPFGKTPAMALCSALIDALQNALPMTEGVE